ncbi:sulfur relay protein TusB/DsrH [Pseudomonas sp. M47T1]|uniref:sulfurtransferase complex subunit TusB n=1 Tax=unclassified Pseudomonas TaxID=196821 RepID=UPI0002606F35|nr:sulfurtransferase complex subunit TusB [Pseudomonas sp. M47T1]EIK96418.1 sulfur relay protein TusB/DsrH [Pseudomonas sp. M47T1]
MATLHVLSHSPFTDQRLASCLRLLGKDDGLLLTGDAVYALLNDSLAHLQGRVYALAEDVQARGISTDATVVDYPGFVQLSIDFDKVNTWL